VNLTKRRVEARDGDLCDVIAGAHKGKAGMVADVHKAKNGLVTITVIQEDGVHFKTQVENILVRE